MADSDFRKVLVENMRVLEDSAAVRFYAGWDTRLQKGYNTQKEAFPWK